eukprot:4129605-Karenia_brevis.AAC.1
MSMTTNLHAPEHNINLDDWRSGKRKRTSSFLNSSENHEEIDVGEIDSDLELFQDLKADVLFEEEVARQDQERAAKRRKRWPNESCRGLEGTTCKFSTKFIGERASVHPERNQWHCLFCDPLIFEQSLKSRGGQFITKALNYFKEQDNN